MGKRILIGLAVVVAGLALFVARQPSGFRVTRSALIAARPSAVFDQVNDFHRWGAWNPWGKLDPAMKQSYEGPAAGPGAVYAYEGNGNVGAGRITIVDARPHESIRLKLEFLKPIAATHFAEFRFEPRDAGTLVTWTMTGENGFVGKAIGLVMDVDRMIGGMFEKGLADMRTVAEAASRS